MQKSFPIFAGLCLLTATLWLQTTHIRPIAHMISRLEEIAYDIQIQARRLTKPPSYTDSPVVIVDVDDNSLEKEGRWPWPRGKLATLINQLKTAGAAVIAFDIIFPESETNPANTVFNMLKKQNLASDPVTKALQKITPLMNNDLLLSRALSTMDTILGISFLHKEDTIGCLPATPILLPKNIELSGIDTMQGYLANISLLQKSAKSAGFINMFPDEDGIVRKTPLLIRYGEHIYPSLALDAVRIYLLSNVTLKTSPYLNETRLEGIQIGNRIIPVDANAEALIPFKGGSYYFPYFSASNVVRGHFPSDAFTGKIVFVGASATSLGDLRATAIQSIYPGVEIHATIAAGILHNNFPSKPAWKAGAEFSMTALLGLLWVFLFPLAGARLIGFFIVLIPTTLFFLNNWLWQATGLVLSVFIPAIFTVALGVLNILYGYFFETRHREKLRAMFGQYVPEKHITEMLARPGDYTLYGEDREMTVLFADIRNFTDISEGLGADQLKDFLNTFFTSMTEIIFRHNGTIDKYIGDMIMAFWGAPLADAQHARNALMAALDMQKMSATLRESFRRKKWPEINIGIGLNTGIMSVGDMGSHFRRNYTVLGDAVNLGSRVEGLTKFYGAKIIATGTTCKGQSEFVFRHLDRVRVKGKQSSVDIHEPLGFCSEMTEALQNEINQYETALSLYFKQAWENAHPLFTELSRHYPHTRLYQIYLQRLKIYMVTPPGPDWDGVYTHTSK